MNLRQQIIQDRVDSIASKLGISQDNAFLRFAHSMVVDQSIHTFNDEDLVDGGQDKQIDTITIERDRNEVTVYIIQAKNTNSFSSNVLIQMCNGLDWVFAKSKADIRKLSNIKFQNKISEYRLEQSNFGPSNINIVVAFVTNGISNDISQEFHQEEKTIRDIYNNNTFASFELLVWGADELISQLNLIENRKKEINEDIPIIYDRNNPSLIKYYAEREGLRGLVCTASAYEIARIVNNDTTGSVFDANIRRFRGNKKHSVNEDIYRTSTENDMSHQFWFLNNGITIVCKSFDAVTDQDNPHVKIKKMQIVNGCQTASTFALAERKKMLARDVKVLLRIYQAPTSELASMIVLTTNNQNEIGGKDLHANDPIQIDIEYAFKRYKYFYERKEHQYDNSPDIDSNRIASNEEVARCYLAVVLRKPSEARAYPYKIWDEMYKEIFGSNKVLIESYIIPWQIFQYISAWIKRSDYKKGAKVNNIRQKLSIKGAYYFVSRITAFLWRKGDNWKGGDKIISDLQKQVTLLDTNPHAIDTYISEAFDILEKIILQNKQLSSDLEKALKSSALNAEIDRYLYNIQI